MSSGPCDPAVAALTSTGALARYSNFGVVNVDIGAPGSGVWSTTPNNTLSRFDGTSMATPHVTGGIALLVGVFLTISIGTWFATHVNDFNDFGRCMEDAVGSAAREEGANQLGRELE